MSGRILTTDAEIDALVRRARALEPLRPRATSATYRESDDKVVITLATGVEVAVPRTHISGLEDAPPALTKIGTLDPGSGLEWPAPALLAKIEILGPGSGLEWSALDVGCDVLELLGDALGLPYWTSDLAPWMRAIGRKGGRVKSAAKTRAARANGKKGGRPVGSVSRVPTGIRLAAGPMRKRR
jgi:hypothetical protein